MRVSKGYGNWRKRRNRKDGMERRGERIYKNDEVAGRERMGRLRIANVREMQMQMLFIVRIPL